MYDGVAILKAYTSIVQDTYGNAKTVIEKTEVFVQPRSVYQSEFYNAAQVGLKPSLTLVLANREDYNGQKVVEYEGKDYEIIRTDWNAQRDTLALVCEEKVKNGIGEPEPEEGEESE